MLIGENIQRSDDARTSSKTKDIKRGEEEVSANDLGPSESQAVVLFALQFFLNKNVWHPLLIKLS